MELHFYFQNKQKIIYTVSHFSLLRLLVGSLPTPLILKMSKSFIKERHNNKRFSMYNKVFL
jgi:hypothetical protein